MKLIKPDSVQTNLQQILKDQRLNWSAKGLYTYLSQLPNQTNVNLIELSTYAKDDVHHLKDDIHQLVIYHYLIINNKLLIMNPLNTRKLETTKAGAEKVIQAHDAVITHQILRNQWQIIWHHEDAQVTKALVKLAKYLNLNMVLYGIQYSKQHCHNYRESLPYLNRLIMKWKQHNLTTVIQTQRWIHQRTLNSRPWNSETQNRIFSTPRRQIINNLPLKKRLPDIFKNNSGKNKKRK